MTGSASSRTGRRRAVRPALIVPLAALLAAGGWFAFGRPSKASTSATPTAVTRTVDVTSGALNQTVSTSATISAAATKDLNFAAAGTVTAVKVKAGDVVKTGDVLATIDSVALTSAVTQADAAVAAGQAKIVADQTTTATATTSTTTVASADAAAAQLAADTANLSALQAQLVAAQTALDTAKLVAPINGTVSVVNLTVGEILGSGGTGGTSVTGTGTGRSSSTLASSSSTGPGGSSNTTTPASSASATTPQVEVISTGAYLVKLSVDDIQVKQVKVGQKATVTLASAAASSRSGRGGQGGGGSAPSTTTTQPAQSTTVAPVTGMVTSVGVVASGSSGVATFPVEVLFAGAPDGYHAGATAQVDIVYNTIPNTIQVPAQAITRAADGTDAVTVSKNGATSKRTVTTGIQSNGMIQITSGLSAGDQVIVTVTARPQTAGTTAGGGGGGFIPPAGGFPGGGRPGGTGG